MNRNIILNKLIETFDFKSYLEIGVDSGLNFEAVQCEYKIGVDPNPASPATLSMTSDEYFESISKTYDLIFVDGLHEHKQVKRDIENSLEHLNKGGVVVCHDMSPLLEVHQLPPDQRQTAHWNGDCWKAWVELRAREDLEMFVVDVDNGCGIIKFGKCNGFTPKTELSFANLEKHRVKWLNLHGWQYFEQWLTQSKQ